MKKRFSILIILMYVLPGMCQDIILHHNETFTGGTIKPWKYGNQFGFEHDYGSTYGVIKAPSGGPVTEFEFPFPTFNNAGDKLGKDFKFSIELSNNKTRPATDTGLFMGVNITLSGGLSVGLAVNGINKFQVIGAGGPYIPFFLIKKYSGHQPWGNYPFSLLGIEKKKDSLLFSINSKTVLRTRIFLQDSTDPNTINPVQICYKSAAFYATSNPKKITPDMYFPVDNFDLTWIAHKGDEMLAGQLLSAELQKYAQYSKPYHGKYIVAKTIAGEQCILNLYGNYVIPPTYDDLYITNQSGIFVKTDGGRDEFFDHKGDYEEYGIAKTKALMASRKWPEFLQAKPLLLPLPLKHFNTAVKSYPNAASILSFMSPLGISSENDKKGLRSSTGIVYYHPGFEDIWVEQVTGVDNQYSRWESDYSIKALYNGKTVTLSLNETNPEKLLWQTSTTLCKKCNGRPVKQMTGYKQGEYVPAEYKSYSNSYIYTNVYGDRWKKTYSGSYKAKEGYYASGEKYNYTETCTQCKGKGYSEKSMTYLLWNPTLKQYYEKTEAVR